jgi:hypothetical protein
MIRGALAVAAALLSALPLRAEITNAQPETASAAQGIAAVLRQAASRPAVWMTYRVPMAADRGRHPCEGISGRTYLEPPHELSVFLRVERGVVTRLRTSAPECDVDAGGMVVVTMTGVTPEDSASWLAGLVTSDGDRKDRVVTPALTALGLQDGAAAIGRLIDLATMTKDAETRRQAMNWLTRATDARARDFVARVLTPRR